MLYKAIIFDLDGTLINTLNELGTVTNHVLTEKGFPNHDIDAYRFFVGEGAANLIRRALPLSQRKKNIIDDCLSLFMKIYNEICGQNASLYDEIPQMLDKLVNTDMKLTVLSNKPHELTLKNISQFLSNWHFEIIFGQREGIPKKPNPAGAIEIANHLNIQPSNFMYLGDTGIDMKTAVSAGMFPIGALWGFRDKKELEESGAKALAENPLDVIELLHE